MYRLRDFLFGFFAGVPVFGLLAYAAIYYIEHR